MSIETKINPQLIGQEYDRQRALNDPFDLMRQQFDNYQGGPVVLGLGAVGGGGAGEKARGILEQFGINEINYRVIATRGYLDINPLIFQFLKNSNIKILVVDDNTNITGRYQRTIDALINLQSKERSISGVLSLGPRTYYPEAARRLGLSSMIIDGAVPDKWQEDTDSNGLPITEYYLPAYLNGVYATTCGFCGWIPPVDSYPDNMDLRVVAQPFSSQKEQYMQSLRSFSSDQCRWQMLTKGLVRGIDYDDLIVTPTADPIYLDPGALSVFGRFLTPEQLGQTYGFWAELITSLSLLAPSLSGRNIALYIRPSVMRDLLTPLVNKYQGRKLKLFGPTDKVIPNNDWLLLRKAGITIGRAPLCVSTAEALAIGDYQITAAIPGRTSDGISYMTEAEALDVLVPKGITRVLYPGDSLVNALKDVIDVKDLQNI